MAGVDVLAAVTRNLDFQVHELMNALIERGWLGEKSRQGFYKRREIPSEGGDQAPKSEILVIDPVTLTYRPRQSPRLAMLDAVRNIDEVGERTKALFLDPREPRSFF